MSIMHILHTNRNHNNQRKTIPLPFVIRNLNKSKSNLRFIYQRPPEFKQKHNNLPFTSWKAFQQSIDDIVTQTTFLQRHKAMMVLLISMFLLFYIYHVITRYLFCFINPNVCDLIQPGYCSDGNNHDDECSQYINWQIGYFVTNLILHLVTLVSMYKLQRWMMLDGTRITNDASIIAIHDICREYSDSLFASYGYFVEFDHEGNSNGVNGSGDGTQKILFRSIVSDGAYSLNNDLWKNHSISNTTNNIICFQINEWRMRKSLTEKGSIEHNFDSLTYFMNRVYCIYQQFIIVRCTRS